jgi:hypothetical protein
MDMGPQLGELGETLGLGLSDFGIFVPFLQGKSQVFPALFWLRTGVVGEDQPLIRQSLHARRLSLPKSEPSCTPPLLYTSSTQPTNPSNPETLNIPSRMRLTRVDARMREWMAEMQPIAGNLYFS